MASAQTKRVRKMFCAERCYSARHTMQTAEEESKQAVTSGQVLERVSESLTRCLPPR